MQSDRHKAISGSFAVPSNTVSIGTLQALDSKLTEIAKTMRENKTILAYEMLRTLQEFVAYERAKQSAQ